MSVSRQSVHPKASSFAREEHGGGTAFALFWVMTCLLLAGLAVDGTNAWRNQQVLQQTADVAAHAGVVNLAKGEGEGVVLNSAIDAIQLNMKTSRWGNVLHDTSTDVVLLNYDAASNSISTSGIPNAVGVVLQRSQLTGNPVNTFLLKIAKLASSGTVDLSSWDVRVASVATLTATRACSSSDGIFAQNQVNVTSSNTFGPRYCLHSQSDIWMPQQNFFSDFSGLSMPDLADCGSKCSDSANPGVEAAKFETNLILPDLYRHITRLAAAFTATTTQTHPDKAAFFANKSRASDLTALIDAGVDTSALTTGSVVSLTGTQFQALTDIPEGLTYDITCTANGNGPNTTVRFDDMNGGNALNDVAIITNCGLDFGSTARVTGSLLISTRQAASATVNASSGAMAGDATGSCNLDTKTYIMSLGDLNVPADFAGSNVSFLVDGNIHLSASSSSATLDHSGVSLMASNEIHISANHTFNACSQPPGGLLPELRVIRHVIPTTGDQVASAL